MTVNLGIAEPDRKSVVGILNGLMERHEKMAWMLRAFLETR